LITITSRVDLAMSVYKRLGMQIPEIPAQRIGVQIPELLTQRVSSNVPRPL